MSTSIVMTAYDITEKRESYREGETEQRRGRDWRVKGSCREKERRRPASWASSRHPTHWGGRKEEVDLRQLQPPMGWPRTNPVGVGGGSPPPGWLLLKINK